MKVNFRANYHKAALAASLPLAGYLGASIWVDAARLEKDFARPEARPRPVSVADAASVERALASLGTQGPVLTDAPNSFTGPELYLLKGSDGVSGQDESE
jgi:hypothetical protein